MAITFTNIWVDKILDPLVKVIRAEFQNQIQVYKGDAYQSRGNCSIRVFGSSHKQLQHSKNGFTNEYSIEIAYYLVSSNFSSEKATEKLYRDISRLEQILFNKKQPSDRSDSAYYDGIVRNISINTKTEDETDVDNLLTAKIDFVCKFTKVS
tara:strand:- start:14137 stop:14592 length:456 start_codon:yes stop_codon:yes gene_type:complete